MTLNTLPLSSGIIKSVLCIKNKEFVDLILLLYWQLHHFYNRMFFTNCQKDKRKRKESRITFNSDFIFHFRHLRCLRNKIHIQLLTAITIKNFLWMAILLDLEIEGYAIQDQEVCVLKWLLT